VHTRTILTEIYLFTYVTPVRIPELSMGTPGQARWEEQRVRAQVGAASQLRAAQQEARVNAARHAKEAEVRRGLLLAHWSGCTGLWPVKLPDRQPVRLSYAYD
jgi:hypothetical protein